MERGIFLLVLPDLALCVEHAAGASMPADNKVMALPAFGIPMEVERSLIAAQ